MSWRSQQAPAQSGTDGTLEMKSISAHTRRIPSSQNQFCTTRFSLSIQRRERQNALVSGHTNIISSEKCAAVSLTGPQPIVSAWLASSPMFRLMMLDSKERSVSVDGISAGFREVSVVGLLIYSRNNY